MANDPSSDERQDTVDGLNYFKLTLFIIIFIAGLILNTFLFLAVTRKRIRHRRTARSFIRLVQNLALSDLMLLLLAVPFDSGWWDPSEFPYGGRLCKILWPLKTASFQAIVLTYVMLSFHRTYGVKQALFGQMNDIFIIFVLFMIWIGSLLTVIPYVIFLNYDVAKLSCVEMWPLLDDRRAYSAVLFLLQYLLPLMVLVVMYFVARFELKNAVTKDRHLQKRAERHRRINTMLIVYIVVFAILILPEQINRFVLDFGQGNLRAYFFSVMKLMYTLTLTITVTNPILFFYYNPEFRKDLNYFLVCNCFRKHDDSVDAKSDSFSIELPPPGSPSVPYAVVDSRPQTLERRPEPAPEYPGSRHSSRRGSREPVFPEKGSHRGSQDRVSSHRGSQDMGPRSGSRGEMPRYGSRDLRTEEPYPTKSPYREDEPPYRSSRERLSREEPYRSRSRDRLPSDDRDPPYRPPSRERDEPYRRSREPSEERVYRAGSRDRVSRDRDESPYRGSRERIPDDDYRRDRPRDDDRDYDRPYRSSSRERVPPYEEPYRAPPRDVGYRAPREEDFPRRGERDYEKGSISDVHVYNEDRDDDQGSEML